MNLLEENDEDGKNIEGIFIAPPDSAILTDEDSGDEDDGGLVDNLSGKQLLAGAEIRFNRNNDSSVDVDEENNVAADDSEHEEMEISDVQPGAHEDSVDKTVRVREDNSNPTEGFRLRKAAVLKEIKDDYVKELAEKKEFARERKNNTNLRPPKKRWVQADMEESNTVFPFADFSKY